MTSDLPHYHMLSAGHEPLVDHLGGVIAPRVNVNALLDHRVRPGAQCFPHFVPTWLDLRLRRPCSVRSGY